MVPEVKTTEQVVAEAPAAPEVITEKEARRREEAPRSDASHAVLSGTGTDG